MNSSDRDERTTSAPDCALPTAGAFWVKLSALLYLFPAIGVLGEGLLDERARVQSRAARRAGLGIAVLAVAINGAGRYGGRVDKSHGAGLFAVGSVSPGLQVAVSAVAAGSRDRRCGAKRGSITETDRDGGAKIW